MKQYTQVFNSGKQTREYRILLIELYAATVNYSSRYELDGQGIESQW